MRHNTSNELSIFYPTDTWDALKFVLSKPRPKDPNINAEIMYLLEAMAAVEYVCNNPIKG